MWKSRRIRRVAIAAAAALLAAGGILFTFLANGYTPLRALQTPERDFRASQAVLKKASSARSFALGRPLNKVVCEAEYGPCTQSFEGGQIRWSRQEGAVAAPGDLMKWWISQGGPGGSLGLPQGDPVCFLPKGGCQWSFTSASAVRTPSGRIVQLPGAIAKHWDATGGAPGPLGYPAEKSACGLAAGGCRQGFEGGDVYWSPQSGVHTIGKTVARFWRQHGAEGGQFGYPTGAESCTDTGCRQDFQRGSISLQRDGSPHQVAPEIAEYWAAHGGATGKFGAPSGEARCRQGAGGRQCNYPFAGGQIKWREGTGVIDCSKQKCVALTFDDGPAASTPRLLDILQEKNVDATFFLLGQNAKKMGEIVKREHNLLMQLANHSWGHPAFTKLPDDQVRSEIENTNNVIRELTGQQARLMRPPYGDRNRHVENLIHGLGMKMTLWDVDTHDWQHHDPAQTIQRTMNTVRPGSVVLLHDIHETTVNAVAGLVDQLRAAGYTLVTVDDLGRY